MRDSLLFAFVNGSICVAIAFICLCRLNAMHCYVLLKVRVKYACFIGAALVSAIKPVWGEWPDWGSVSTACLVFVGLLCASREWRSDQPPSGATDFHQFPPFPESRL